MGRGRNLVPVTWLRLRRAAASKYTSLRQGVATAAQPRRALGRWQGKGVGEGSQTPLNMVKARYHGSTGLRHVLPAFCANGVNLLAWEDSPTDGLIA